MRDILQSRYLRNNVAHKQLARTSLSLWQPKKNIQRQLKLQQISAQQLRFAGNAELKLFI